MRHCCQLLAAAFALAALTASFSSMSAPRGVQSPPLIHPPPAEFARPVRLGAPAGQAGVVLAALLPSWSDGGASGWAALAQGWQQFGTTPLAIDWTLAGASDFTYEQLQAIGADVLVLSDPAGGLKQYSAAHVAAIARYAREGHNVLGTYKLFRWDAVVNNALAPIFGLEDDVNYSTQNVPISNQFTILNDSYLTSGLNPAGWTSGGYPFTESVEGGLPWGPSALVGAVPVAQCDASKAIVSVFRTPSYVAVFISNMPEYSGNTSDLQLLYNALTFSLP